MAGGVSKASQNVWSSAVQPNFFAYLKKVCMKLVMGDVIFSYTERGDYCFATSHLNMVWILVKEDFSSGVYREREKERFRKAQVGITVTVIVS